MRQVNEMEIRAGLSPIVFPDLPDFPPSGDKMAGTVPADERGEHYEFGKNGGGTPGSPVGGGETPAGKTDSRPPAGN